jgi:hypothetical protein
MLEAQLKMLNGKILVKVSGETQAELFGNIAKVQQIFDAEAACGLCGNVDLKLSHRQPQGYDYFELVCGNHECGARFQFGQLKEDRGGLFPKRDKGTGGWEIYRADGSGGYAHEPEPPRQQTRAPQQPRNPGPPPPSERW